MATNRDLNKAKTARKDEFYTQLSDIEKELKYYKEHFKDKVVFCNCDDPKSSNFFKYFQLNFYNLGLKKLISTHYETEKPSYKLEIVRNGNGEGQLSLPDYIQTSLKQNGDFRSPECVEILKEADIICTNPPFSLFREYIGQLIEYDKKFIIIGNINAVKYKEIFPYIMNNKIWLGKSIHSGDREFGVPADYPLKAAGCRIDEQGNKYIRVKGIRWFTNLEYEERHEDMILYRSYNASEYPKYDNYNAIEVSKTSEIPYDYYDIMGVPITFIDVYNPDQFEIIGVSNNPDTIPDVQPIGKKWVDTYRSQGGTGHITANMKSFVYITPEGKAISYYDRILIKRRK